MGDCWMGEEDRKGGSNPKPNLPQVSQPLNEVMEGGIIAWRMRTERGGRAPNQLCRSFPNYMHRVTSLLFHSFRTL